jgi:hypothetical protein
MTTDVCEVDFPPASYGGTLEEVEATVQEVIERVFRDDDGILRSGVNGRTMKPLRLEDVKDSPLGLGRYPENSAMPRAVKPIWLNYENAGQASGKYLQALCAKARVTGDAHPRELARRTVEAIVTLWNNAAATHHMLGGGGRGWFPKPYAGIRDVAQMWECSCDQYADVTLGLQSYYLSMASEQEKRKIEEIIVSFADWWYDHDYSGVYYGDAIWWKRLGYNFYHPHSVGYFLYLNALAESWSPCRKFRHGFETWLDLKGGLYLTKGSPEANGNGIALDCLERLIALRPDLADYWRPAASHQAQHIVRMVEQGRCLPDLPCAVIGFAAHYLATAHRLMPKEGYDRMTRRCLEACTGRENFYAILRGLRVADLPKMVSGDDYRDVFWCEDHVCWLDGYWNSQHTDASSPVKGG